MWSVATGWFVLAVSGGAMAAEPGTAGFDKGFEIRSADDAYVLRIGALLQVQYAYGATVGEEGTAASAFSIPRARLKLGGNVFSDDLGYALVTDFGKGGFATLKDGYLDWTFAGPATLRAGQFKRPFSRQQLTGDSRLALVDRSIVDDAFGLGRDVGVMLHDDPTASPAAEYALGVFDGTGDKPVLTADVLVDPTTGEGAIAGGKLTNVPGMLHPMVVGRVGFNRGEGAKGYSELDLEGGPARGGLAANVEVDLDADDTDDGKVLAGADWYLKAAGIGLTGGVVLGLEQDGAAWTDQQAAALGLWQEASYALDHVAIAARYARYQRLAEDDTLQQGTLGVPILLRGHGLKIQTEAGAIEERAGGDSTLAALGRAQLVLDF